MQVRYQAALRPEGRDYIRAGLPAAEKFSYRFDFAAQPRKVERFRRLAFTVRAARAFRARTAIVFVEPMTGAVDRESLLVQQLANPPNQQGSALLLLSDNAVAVGLSEPFKLCFAEPSLSDQPWKQEDQNRIAVIILLVRLLPRVA